MVADSARKAVGGQQQVPLRVSRGSFNEVVELFSTISTNIPFDAPGQGSILRKMFQIMLGETETSRVRQRSQPRPHPPCLVKNMSRTSSRMSVGLGNIPRICVQTKCPCWKTVSTLFQRPRRRLSLSSHIFSYGVLARLPLASKLKLRFCFTPELALSQRD